MPTEMCAKENWVVHLLHGINAFVDRVVLFEGIAAALFDNVVVLGADPRIVVGFVVALCSLEA